MGHYWQVAAIIAWAAEPAALAIQEPYESVGRRAAVGEASVRAGTKLQTVSKDAAKLRCRSCVQPMLPGFTMALELLSLVVSSAKNDLLCIPSTSLLNLFLLHDAHCELAGP